MKGRFLYIGSFQLPDKNAAAQRVLGIAKLLRLLDYDVVFLDLNKDCRKISGISDEVYGFVRYSQPYPVGMKQWLKYALQPMHVNEILQKYNDWKGVIAYNYPGIALWRLTSICHKKNLLVFADCTEWYEPRFTKLHRMAVTVDTCLRMRWAQKKVDGVIVISSFLANYYQPFTRVVTLPPMVDVEEKKWKQSEFIRTNDRTKLYYVGSPGGRLGKDRLDLIIKALRNCQTTDKLIFNVVGITEQQFLNIFPEYQYIVDILKMQGSLLFYGRLSHLEAIKLLKEANYSIFFRCPNRANMAGFPTKFVESITCGVPVICNDTSDLGKYLNNRRNGIIVDLREETITNLFNTLKNKHIDVDRTIFDFRNFVVLLQSFINVVENGRTKSLFFEKI